MELAVVETQETFTHVKLSGKLDIQGAEKIDLPFTAHVAAPRKPAMVDMSGVSFLSSIGIRTLLSCARTLGRAGASLALYAMQPPVAETIHNAGLDDVFVIAETAADARLGLGLPPA